MKDRAPAGPAPLPRPVPAAAPSAAGEDAATICRLWYGWTTPENADSYEALIRSTIFPGILGRGIAGLNGLELLRRPFGAEVEFVTIMRFESWDAVTAFAGPEWEVSVVPPAARAVLARFDAKAQHYEVRVEG